ncbi:MAG: UDP-N-acetylmuramate dehydrogenase [Anaerolineales bacterium]|nr:UDP-N-acetylmuramate dehydrogenase [Anaerolineales bacterium]MDW8446208.1 UDP-N-acetylmuramate dehydrogenase [Anaerolineales bacterium]
MNERAPSFPEKTSYWEQLQRVAIDLGLELQTQVPLSRYTSARIGGPAQLLVEVHSSAQLKPLIAFVWEHQIPYTLLGGGSNVLISDEGLDGLVIINRAKGRARMRFDLNATPPLLWADAGVSLSHLARQAAARGLSGLEWACGIPGTLGGAVVNNAGAFGGEISQNLAVVTILHRHYRGDHILAFQEQWTAAEMNYQYRSSRLKHSPGQAVVLSALLRLERGNPREIREKMEELSRRRRQTQPPGASLGSMFKNPPGDFAGRLIDAAGLKGLTIGGAMISPLHANFFINLGHATAGDVWDLIQTARQAVREKFGIDLELEIQPLGNFPTSRARSGQTTILIEGKYG